MSLNTEVKGNPGSIREAAGWLTKHAGKVDATGTDVVAARGMSEGGWTGKAGEGFRGVMSRTSGKIDGLAGDMNGSSGALHTYADDLDTVHSRMGQARSVARTGGLHVAGHTIHEPGKAPADPIPVDEESSQHQRGVHDRAVAAQQAHAKKVKAYQEASKTVLAARAKHRDAETVLLDFLKGQARKTPFTITDVSSGLAGAVAKQTSKYRTAAANLQASVDRASRYAAKPGKSLRVQAKADALKIEREMGQRALNDKAVATRTAKIVDKLPNGVKKVLSTNLDFRMDASKIGSKVLRGSVRALGKFPVVGLGITAASTAYDIHQGKDPGKAIASNASGFVAGSLAVAGVAACGGPVGWGVAAGALVGAGVGFAVDEWGDDIAGAAVDLWDSVF